MPGQGFTVVTVAPSHRAGGRWIENWDSDGEKELGWESYVCLPALSSLGKRVGGRWAGESKAMAVLHTAASTSGRCPTALCRYHPGEVLILLRDALTGKLTRGWMTHLVTNAVWYPPVQNAQQYQQPCNKCIKGKIILNISCGYQTSPTQTCILLLLPCLYFQIGFQEHLFAWSTSPVKSPKPRFHPYT